MKEYLDKTKNGQTTFKVSKTTKVDHLIKEKKFDEALIEIERLLKDDDIYTNWRLKGIILDNLSRFSEAVECFDKALKLNECDEILLDKANVLYDWSKVSFFPEGNYDKALVLIDNALDVIPESEDASEFYFLKAEILEALEDLVESHKSYLIAYKEFEKLDEFEYQVDFLKNSTENLVNIVGCYFYNFSPQKGVVVDLVRDEDNEHDADAIAVIFEDKLVGYIANNDYTLIDEVKSASDIKRIVKDDQKAEIMFIYMGEYVVAKLL